jgi:hypothetical protein
MHMPPLLHGRLKAATPSMRSTARRCAPGRNVWPQLLRGYGVAFVLTAAPVALHILLPPFAVVFCVCGAFLVSRYLEEDVPIVVLAANIFQNVFISLSSSNFTEVEQIDAVKVYGFITTIVCYTTVATGFFQNARAFSPFVRRLIQVSVGVLAIVTIYFLFGLAVNWRNSAVYLRNIALPILFFQTNLIVGVKRAIPVIHILLILLGLSLTCAYLELGANDLWLKLINGDQYYAIVSAKRLLNVGEIRDAAQHGFVVTHPQDYMQTLLFNTTLTADIGILIQRISGPNFNGVGFAYLLATLMAFLAIHGYRWTAALTIPALVAGSAKGATILALGSIGFFWLARRLRGDAAVTTLAVCLLVYAGVIFQIGYAGGNFHVLGLLGGVNGFLSLPIGHTLGEGGNQSIADFSQLDWGSFQRSGASTVAVESAFGVLIYQMGVFAAAVIGFYLWIAWTCWRLYKTTGAPAFAFSTSAIAICLVNGFFQEDAYFVPLSMPVVMGLAALTLGAADRVLRGAQIGAPG